ncbi:MAG: alpha/beta fold hydrolase [Vicinamibacterales bacterium]
MALRSMQSNLADFQRRFPLTRWTAGDGEWQWRDTDQDAARAPLVLLPGAGGTGDTLYRAIEGLRRERRMIAVTYPALSDAQAMASGLLAVLSKAGIERFDLFGSSLGGYVAQLCASRAPQRVGRCMFANSFHDASWLQRKISHDELSAMAPEQHLANALAQLRAASDDTAEKADFKRTMLALVGTQQTAEMARSALLAVLTASPAPTVELPDHRIAILDTADDPVVDQATREAMRRRYPECAQFRLRTGGHYPALLNPTGFTAALLKHFSGDWPTP